MLICLRDRGDCSLIRDGRLTEPVVLCVCLCLLVSMCAFICLSVCLGLHALPGEPFDR